LYQFRGSFEHQAWLSGIDCVRGTRLGKIVFTFADGGLYSVLDPMLDISHLTSKDKIVSYAEKMIIKDHINKIDAEIEYNPKVE